MKSLRWPVRTFVKATLLLGWCGPKNRILLREDATASLEPGKSTGALRKTTVPPRTRTLRNGPCRPLQKVPLPWLRGGRIRMECVLAVRRLTTDLWPEATVFAGFFGSPYWLPIIKVAELDCGWGAGGSVLAWGHLTGWQITPCAPG